MLFILLNPVANAFRRGATFSAVAEKAEVYFSNIAFIEQYTHKQRRANGIGDHHWCSRLLTICTASS